MRKGADEYALVQRLLARDELALRLLETRYGGSLLSVIVRVVRNRELVEDLLQEGLLKVLTSIASDDAEKGACFVDGAGMLQPGHRRAAQPAPPLPPQHEAAGGLRSEPGSGTGGRPSTRSTLACSS